jgi:hypothetical protein
MFFLRCAVAAVALLAIIGDVAGADSHVYAAGDEVEMLVNTVGPYSNPSETYQYYELPFCKPMHVEQRANSLGEVLEGSMKQTSMYEIRFGGKTRTTKQERETLHMKEQRKVEKEKRFFFPFFTLSSFSRRSTQSSLHCHARS